MTGQAPSEPGIARELVDDLLARAGLTGPWQQEALGGVGYVNDHAGIALADGTRLVVRRYRWPWPGDEPFDRGAKEAWLLPLLTGHAIPVPELLATTYGAALFTRVDGELLAEHADAEHAWRDLGASLRRVHSLDFGFDAAGLVVSGGMAPFEEGTWGAWHVANAFSHATRLAASRPDLRIDVTAIGDVMEWARPLLDARPIRLLHNDPHPWNVLVHPVDGVWRLAAWLDWEFAWAADPQYDLMKNGLQRVSDIGPTPSSFYEGYGSGLEEPWFSLYALGFHLWMANDAIAGERTNLQSHRAAFAFVADLDAQLARLRDLLDEA